MFGRKKETKTHPKAVGGLSQFGLFDLPDINALDANVMDGGENNDDDSTLEAELLALTSGNVPTRPKRSRPAPTAPQPNLDVMVAESLKDIPSDEEISGDDDDPELLHELGILTEEDPTPEDPAPSTPVTPPKINVGNSLVNTLEERLKMYQIAEKNAKEAGESSRARRFGRGIKTLHDLLKQAKLGRVVNEEDIPPPVAVTLTKKADTDPVTEEPTSNRDMVPTRPAPQPPAAVAPPQFGVPLPGMASAEQKRSPQKKEAPSPPLPLASTTSNQSTTIAALLARRDEYKLAALQAKKIGDRETAINYVRVVKKFEFVISAVESGQAVDLNEMPPPPLPVSSVTAAPIATESAMEEGEKQKDADTHSSGEAAEGEVQPEPELYNAPSTPTTVMEALLQRLEKYKSVEKAAKEEGNSSKARRIGRIVKQYETAVKLHKAGKPVPIDELPTPPGFAPIPQDGESSATAAPSSPPSQPSAGMEIPTLVPSPHPSPRPAPKTQPSSPESVQPPPEKANVRKSPQSRQEKQMAQLLERQKEFKEAALQAKRKGELNQAKEYLRLAKGFDPLIEATTCGLPVDMSSVPVPPNTKIVLESDFDIVDIDDCLPGSDSEIFEKLEEDLLKQAKMCLTTRDHFKAIGDVASANRFEQLAVHSKKDLDAVRYAHKRNEPIPKFHYENKSFSIVQCCTELGDNDLELTIVQGINYNVSNPKDVDTYVRFEFPYPNDYPQKDKTAVIKNSNNPQYDQIFPLTIQRNVRACQRIFKRQSLKCEVWSRGGFFRGDALIGTANIKLQPLETKCILHEAYDLLEGRKAVGGKLEVKIRIRNPIVTKQVEQVQEKWLVIDSL